MSEAIYNPLTMKFTAEEPSQRPTANSQQRPSRIAKLSNLGTAELQLRYFKEFPGLIKVESSFSKGLAENWLRKQ